MKRIVAPGLILLILISDMTAQEARTRKKKALTDKTAVEVIDSTLFLVPGEEKTGMVPTEGNITSEGDLIPFLEDRDGNIYTTLEIAGKIWMIQNLRTTVFNDGSKIPEVSDNAKWTSLKDPAYCWYCNNPGSKEFYGALYNWYAVQTGMLCPAGWHVPSDAEWTEMEIYLQNNDFNYDGTVDADLDRETKNKIAKSLASEMHWSESTIKGSIGNTDYQAYRNKSRFTALPAGCRKSGDGSFDEVTFSGFWWSSTESDSGKAWIRTMNGNESATSRADHGKTGGYSVRCVKD